MPPSQSRRWCFTINNYNEDDISNLNQLLADQERVVFGVYGRETGESGTPHLQGFIVYRAAVRFNRIQREIPRGHYEIARGTSQQCRDYCIKDGDFLEFGIFPGNSGQRNDLLAIKEWGQQFIAEHGRPPTRRECFNEQWVATHRYPHLLEGFEAIAPPPIIQAGEPRQWQLDLETELMTIEADDRSVIFYVDPEGNKGKSWFIRYMVSKYPDDVLVLQPGKFQDMAYAVDTTKRIYLLNVARGQMEYLQYAILESIKDRMVMSTKYRPQTKLLRFKTHVVVMCNEHPDMNKMSVDRYVIRNI